MCNELQKKMDANGKGFAQDGHSCTVAGLAGHRLGGFSLMSLRPNYRSSVRITNAEDIFCRPACIKLMLAAVFTSLHRKYFHLQQNCQ